MSDQQHGPLHDGDLITWAHTLGADEVEVVGDETVGTAAFVLAGRVHMVVTPAGVQVCVHDTTEAATESYRRDLGQARVLADEYHIDQEQSARRHMARVSGMPDVLINQMFPMPAPSGRLDAVPSMAPLPSGLTLDASGTPTGFYL